MKKYNFKIDENNELICTGIIDGKGFYKRGINAIKLLKKLDKHGEMNCTSNNNDVILNNHYWEITIENVNKFIDTNYIDEFKNNKDIIINNIKSPKTKPKKNYKVVGAVAASAAILALGVTTSFAALNKPKTKEVISEKKVVTVRDEINELKKQREELLAITQAKEELRQQQQLLLEQRQAEEEAIAAYNTQKESILEQTVYIDINQNWDDQRRYDCEEYYGEAIEEIAPKFGLSPNIIKAMASQEGGGRLPNVMQVATGWYNTKIEYYDQDLQRWHQITSTSGETRDTDDVLYISKNDPNISVYFGCAVLVRSLNRNQGNLFAGMIEYNRGNADGLVNITANSEGVSHDELLGDYYNSNIQYHDGHNYIQECLKFMDNDPITYIYVNKETNETEYITWYPIFRNLEEEDVIINNIGEEPERVLTVSDNTVLEDNSQVLQKTL